MQCWFTSLLPQLKAKVNYFKDKLKDTLAKTNKLLMSLYRACSKLLITLSV